VQIEGVLRIELRIAMRTVPLLNCHVCSVSVVGSVGAVRSLESSGVDVRSWRASRKAM